MDFIDGNRRLWRPMFIGLWDFRLLKLAGGSFHVCGGTHLAALCEVARSTMACSGIPTQSGREFNS